MSKIYRVLLITPIIIVLIFAPMVLNTSNPVYAQGTDCVASTGPSGTYNITVCLTSPASGATLTGNSTVTATATVSGVNPGVQRMIFYLNGLYLATDYESPYTFILPTTKWVDGSYTLSVGALMRDTFPSSQASRTINFNNGITTPPVNTNQFHASTGNPPASGQPFVVVATGDGASGEVKATQVTDLIASINPNLFLYLGDVYERGSFAEFYNWYGVGATNFGRFRSITNPTIGNHEYDVNTALGYFDYWNNVPNYYSYNAGGWHFVSLNSNTMFEPVGTLSAQYNWLQQDLAASSGVCTIVYYHHPLFNIGPEGSTGLLADIWSLMAQYGVDIVLNGHDHTYQRWVPLDGSGQPSPNGITEFVAGGAGHGLETFPPGASDSRLAYSNDTNPAVFGALVLQLNPNGATFSYRSTNGSILDSGVVPCVPASTDTQAPSVPTGLTGTPVSIARVDLNWSASTDNTGVNGYTIYRNGASIATVGGTTLTFSDTTVTAATTYSYRVDAFDLANNHSAKSTAVSVTTPNVPANLTFPAGADTYVSAASPTTTFGTALAFRTDASPDLHAYLRFTVSGLGGAPITRALLKVYAQNSSTPGINALAVSDNSWNELTMNYTNTPLLGNVLASSGAFAANNWVTLDVTSYVTGEGTYSFGITTPGSTSLGFSSRESGANYPRLVLDFTPQPTITPTNTNTPTRTPTRTATPSPTITNTPTRTATKSPTPTPTMTNTASPTATLGQSLTLTPVADAYVNAASVATNYGISTALRVDASPDVHSYLRFTVPALNGKSISQARLRIFATSGSTLGLNVLGVSNNTWGETTVNYSNAPALGSVLAASSSVTAATWTEFDVTSYVNGEGSFNFGVTTPGLTAIGLSSREAGANSPQLLLSFGGPTNTPTSTSVITNTPTPTPTRTNTPIVTNTPTFTPTRTNTAGPTFTPTATLTKTNTSTPTPTATLSQTLNLTPDVDSYVNAASTTTNYGTLTALRVDASPDVHSYLRFTIPNLAGKSITQARLMIFASSASGQGISAQTVADNSWGETTITYNNAPALGGVLTTSPAVTAGTWITLDVTSYITGQGTYSFGVTTPGSTAISLSSREAGANSPVLVIDLQ